jgi:hypothetical protein
MSPNAKCFANLCQKVAYLIDCAIPIRQSFIIALKDFGNEFDLFRRQLDCFDNRSDSAITLFSQCYPDFQPALMELLRFGEEHGKLEHSLKQCAEAIESGLFENKATNDSLNTLKKTIVFLEKINQTKNHILLESLLKELFCAYIKGKNMDEAIEKPVYLLMECNVISEEEAKEILTK